MRISDWSSDVCSSDLDRYIKGECPKCGTPDQYGDNCENCGAAYAPTDLKHPKSVVSGATPVLKDSEHFFFELPKFQGFLEQWLDGDVAHTAITAKIGRASCRERVFLYG